MTLIIRVAILSIIFAGCDGDLYEGNLGNSIFPKNAVMAQATIKNARQIQSIVVQDHEEQYDTRITTKRSRGQNIGLIMKEVNDIAREKIPLETYALPIVADSRGECYDGGYMSVKGYGGEISGITLEVDFENCESNGKKINGKISSEHYGAEPKLKGLKYTDTSFISDVSISKDGITRKILKGSSIKTEIVRLQSMRGWGKRMTINSIIEIDNIKTAQENATYDIFLFYSKNITMSKGRIYIDNLASYVDYDSNYDVPKNAILVDPSGLVMGKGENRYSTANGGKIKFVIKNRQTIAYIDNDGDGVYELNNSVK